MPGLCVAAVPTVAGGLRAAGGWLFTPQLVQLGATLTAACLAPLRPALVLWGASAVVLTAEARPASGTWAPGHVALALALACLSLSVFWRPAVTLRPYLGAAGLVALGGALWASLSLPRFRLWS